MGERGIVESKNRIAESKNREEKDSMRIEKHGEGQDENGNDERGSIRLLKRVAPEISGLLEKRYDILRVVRHNQPIGRRLLSEQLAIGERVVRGEVEFLKNRQLLTSDAAGVSLTEECEKLLPELAGLVHEFRGLAFLENFLQNKIGLTKVCIVPGDLDEQSMNMRELGKAAGKYLVQIVEDNWVIAVSGGTTMAEVARQIPPTHGKRGILVVPARGGLGEVVEIQSNTIAARIARGLGGNYRLLYVPDAISEEALENFVHDHKILETINLAKKANLLLHGIGVAKMMAARRELDWQSLLLRARKLPVGEAFGYYFAEDGSVAVTAPTVGPRLEELSQFKQVVAVAGGKSKARAILAVLKAGFIKTLITDEGAAEVMREILEDG
ncbi:MAG: sugar-binding transcriptional regulator [Peptococcia bacterium]|jgi:central glycolytic genes regulator